MAAGIIKALFGFGKMKTVPWTQMTPELHNQLSSQLGKLMFVVKSQNLKLTKFQQDYLMNQLKHMDEFEKRVLSPRVTKDTSVDDLLKGPHRDERGRVWDFGTKDRPFPGFTPKIVPKETDAQIKARMIKENRRNVQKSYLRQLDEKILKVEEGFLTKADLDNMSPDALDSLRRNVDPHGMHKHFGSEEIGKIDDFASGGRIGFAAGGAIIKELVKRIYAVKAGTGIYKGLSETNKTQLIKKFISELEAAPGGKKYLDNLWTKKIKKLEKEDRLKEIEQKSAAQSLAIKNYPEGPSTLPWSKEQEMHWKRLMGEDIKEELVDTDYIIDQADELLRKKASGGIARVGMAGGGALFKFIEKLFIKASNDIRLGRGLFKDLTEKQRIVQHDNLTKMVEQFQKTKQLPEGAEQYFGVDAKKAFAAAEAKATGKLSSKAEVEAQRQEQIMEEAYEEIRGGSGFTGHDLKYDADILAESLAKVQGKDYAALGADEVSNLYSQAYKRVSQDFLKKRQAEKALKDVHQKIELQMFDTKGRKPNAYGGIAGQLHLNEGGRARFANGSPAIDPRMYQSYAQNRAENEAARLLNAQMRSAGGVGPGGGSAADERQAFFTKYLGTQPEQSALGVNPMGYDLSRHGDIIKVIAQKRAQEERDRAHAQRVQQIEAERGAAKQRAEQERIQAAITSAYGSPEDYEFQAQLLGGMNPQAYFDYLVTGNPKGVDMGAGITSDAFSRSINPYNVYFAEQQARDIQAGLPTSQQIQYGQVMGLPHMMMPQPGQAPPTTPPSMYIPYADAVTAQKKGWDMMYPQTHPKYQTYQSSYPAPDQSTWAPFKQSWGQTYAKGGLAKILGV